MLHGDGAQVGCSTFLNVNRQTLLSTKYTCQVLDEQNQVKLEEIYTPDTGGGRPSALS